MKTIIFPLVFLLMLIIGLHDAPCQWMFNGNHIYNTNSGNVGIGITLPPTLLYVSRSMTEPTITIRNMGGVGGATYAMVDNASGANWKFKATNAGGFKIRDHANGLDVVFLEKNSAANLLYLKSGGSIGIGTSTPDNSALVDMSSTTKGFLVPRMTQSQIESVSSPSNGMLVFCTSDEKFYAYIASAFVWKEVLFVMP